MTNTLLILGGYGVFGRRIATALSQQPGMEIYIAGRDLLQAKEFAESISAQALQTDVSANFESALSSIQPHIVINCAGPFQGQDYAVPMGCIRQGIHYIDLADAREYVAGFPALDEMASAQGVIAVTGASTVPAISSAILDYFLKSEFREIHSVDYGVTPGNQTPRGIATVAAILSYVGKPFATLVNGRIIPVYGWQDLHLEAFPEIGRRWMSNCNIPDLELFVGRYPSLQTIRFYAGLELSFLHLGLWLLSWLPRIGLMVSLKPYAKIFRNISLWFYPFGTSSGGMHMKMSGLSQEGKPLKKSWYIIAKDGDGPQIPAVPAIVLAKSILSQKLSKPGAYSAMGVIDRDEIMHELKSCNVKEVIE